MLYCGKGGISLSSSPRRLLFDLAAGPAPGALAQATGAGVRQEWQKETGSLRISGVCFSGADGVPPSPVHGRPPGLSPER